jgi:glycerol-3-phosphate dehydrogenase
MSETTKGLLRQGIQLAAGILVALGVMDESTAATVSGGLLSIIAAGWSWYKNQTTVTIPK